MAKTTKEILDGIKDKFRRAEIIENGVVDAWNFLHKDELPYRIRTERNKMYRMSLPHRYGSIKAPDLCVPFDDKSHRRFIEVKEKTGFVLSPDGKLATGLNKSEFADFIKLLPHADISFVFYHHPDGIVYRNKDQEAYKLESPLPSGLFEINLIQIQKWDNIDAWANNNEIVCWHLDSFEKIMEYEEFNAFLQLARP